MAAAEQVVDLVNERVLTTDILPVLEDTDDTPATNLASFEKKLQDSLASAAKDLDVVWHPENETFMWSCNPCIASFGDDYVADADLLRQWFLAELAVCRAASELAKTTPSDTIHLYLRALRDRQNCVVGGILYARFGALGVIDTGAVDLIIRQRASRAKARVCATECVPRKRARSPDVDAKAKKRQKS